MYKYIIPHVPDSLNKYAGRQNCWEYRQEKNAWKQIVSIYCRPKPAKPIEKAIVTLHYYFGSNRRHDPDNYAGKMILDGLTEAGIIKDDSFACIRLIIEGSIDKANPRTEITIQEI